jgi:hypothetical protein
LITGFKLSSDSVVDLDFRTGAELDRRSIDEFFVPFVFFLSSAMIVGGFLIVEIIFLEFFLILLLVLLLLLFEFVSVSDVSDSELLIDGLMMIVLRRAVVVLV